MSVKGKVILVTGASQGIGRGIALRLAKDGADIALVDIKADKLQAVAREVEALGVKVTTFVADVSKHDEVYAAVDHAEKELGGFDGLCCTNRLTAGRPLSPDRPILRPL